MAVSLLAQGFCAITPQFQSTTISPNNIGEFDSDWFYMGSNLASLGGCNN